jgi:hypothetical protein
MNMKRDNVQSWKKLNGMLLLLLFTGALMLRMPGAFAADGPSCANSPESRQLDFWLGDWTIGAPGGSAGATSTVFLRLDQCMVVERWDGGRGHQGENMFAYSADDKGWHGMFVDNQGRVHVFVDGKVATGSAEFSGPSRGANGESVLNRIKIVRVGPDKVEQTWQKSVDNGATWSTEFRGEYARKKP